MISRKRCQTYQDWTGGRGKFDSTANLHSQTSFSGLADAQVHVADVTNFEDIVRLIAILLWIDGSFDTCVFWDARRTTVEISRSIYRLCRNC